jgi:hypothetical protein
VRTVFLSDVPDDILTILAHLRVQLERLKGDVGGNEVAGTGRRLFEPPEADDARA